MSAFLFWTIFATFIGSLVGLGKLGEVLSKIPAIRQFTNSRPGIAVFMALVGTSFLTAMAGAASSRLGLIAGGVLAFTFFMSIAIFSEKSPGSKRARCSS